eukprot:4493176-Pleurochrysis_carterae.AAC.2
MASRPASRPASAATRPGGRAGARETALGQELLLSLHKCLFGTERDLPTQWAAQGFAFREAGLLCGLTQHEGGPCGVLAAVQAFVIRQLILDADGDHSAPLTCTREQAGAALVSALATIIWNARVGRLASVVVCRRAELPPLREAADELLKTECNSLDAVLAAVQSGAGAFIRPRGAG